MDAARSEQVDAVADRGTLTAPRRDADRAPPGERDVLPAAEVVAERFQLVRHLASGGMGAVYEALDLLLDVPVAVKLMHPELTRDDASRRQFGNEVRLARRITHPNVCRVFDAGLHRGRAFLTMELCRGEPLSRRLAREGRLAEPAAAALAAQLLAGLAATHAADVIHGDLKPSNVLLAHAGARAVLSDFGLAHTTSGARGRAVGGTPSYMSPEQALGEPLSPASDLFSLGVVLFEILTGELPWPADDRRTIALARLGERAPRLRDRGPELGRAWDETIAACLERDPLRRPERAEDVARALRLVR